MITLSDVICTALGVALGVAIVYAFVMLLMLF